MSFISYIPNIFPPHYTLHNSLICPTVQRVPHTYTEDRCSLGYPYAPFMRWNQLKEHMNSYSPHTFGCRCSVPFPSAPSLSPSSSPFLPSSVRLRRRCCSSCCCQLKLSSPNLSNDPQHIPWSSTSTSNRATSSTCRHITLGTYVSTCPCLMLVICAIFKLMISDKRSFTRLMMDSYHQQICHWWMDFCPSISLTPCPSTPPSGSPSGLSLSVSVFLAMSFTQQSPLRSQAINANMVQRFCSASGMRSKLWQTHDSSSLKSDSRPSPKRVESYESLRVSPESPTVSPHNETSTWLMSVCVTLCNKLIWHL